jgi:isopentenyl diphosphate isomerase/L-lactate dehydrogenase-like FMN-dependent dehydrogenase
MTISRRDLMVTGAAAIAASSVPTSSSARPRFSGFGLDAPSSAHRVLQFADIETLERQARQILGPARFAAMNPTGDGGTCGAFDRTPIVPRPWFDADVSRVDTRTHLLGDELSLPVITAPMQGQGTFHVEAEIATARGTRRAGTLKVSSAQSDTPLEAVAQAVPEPGWIEIAQDASADLRRTLERASALRFSALVLANASAIAADHVAAVRDMSELPVIVKGVFRQREIERLLSAGASAFWLSDHGRHGASGESAVARLRVTADIVAGRVPIVFDGGIRRGIDVFKALALGATVVAIGRPVLWGLVNGGAPGIASVYRHLADELRSAMMLAGVSRIAEIGRGHVAMTEIV